MRFNTHRIELWFFVLIRACVRRLSIGTARKLGAFSGVLSYYSFLRRRHYALRNLGLVFPELSRREKHRLARKAYRRTGATLLESAVWSTRDTSRHQDCFEIEGREHIEGVLASGKGFIILGAHYGVWETGLMPYEDALRPVTVIAKRTTNPLMQAEADAWREQRGFIQVLSGGATLKIFKTLKRGDRAGFIADQRVQPENGILLPFLGVPAWTSPMMAAMSIRTGVPVLPHFAEPLGKDRYRISYLEPIEPDPELGKGPEAVREMTRRYNAVVEERIRARPELWFWVHERWIRIKRYRWDSTKERWRKRSGLPAPATPTAQLPVVLRKLVKSYRRGRPLQEGESLVLDGFEASERRSLAIELGHATIAAGRSFAWLEQGVDTKTTQETFEQLDQFDVVALCFGGGHSGENNDAGREGSADLDRFEALARHRVEQRRSVIVVRGTSGARGSEARTSEACASEASVPDTSATEASARVEAALGGASVRVLNLEG